jgi:drug/metabolite transporter (DMT)-like permease
MNGIDRGVIYMFFSVLLSAMTGAAAKMLTDDMSALEIVFFRNLFGIIFILITLSHTPSKSKGGKPLLLLQRGIFGFTALFLFFYTITTIPLGEAVTLNKTSPLFVAILAFFLLGEKLSIKGVIALFLGFLGVVLITKPFGVSIGLAHFLGLLGGFFAAAAYTTIRKIKDIYDSRSIVMSFMSVGIGVPIVMFMIAPFYLPQSLEFIISPFTMPTSYKVWGLLLVIGVTATISQWLLTLAFSGSNAGIIGIVSYASIPFAIFFGVLLGDNIPDVLTFIGIALIVLSGLMVKKG